MEIGHDKGEIDWWKSADKKLFNLVEILEKKTKRWLINYYINFQCKL